MIKRIFFDLDETLIYTTFGGVAPNFAPHENHVSLQFDDDPDKIYFSIIRPNATKIIKIARDLVGAENVFVLTAATREYAHQINDKAEFGFKRDHIFTKEDLDSHRTVTCYGASAPLANEKISSEFNVLIDNLPPRYNEGKMAFIGINVSRYIHVRDYFGVNFPDDPFVEDVTNKLKEL